MKKSSIINKLPKIIVVLGPTASGKSDLALKLAKKFNGEVISADSRQVYKGLDIGTGKITTKEMQGVPHHLLDVDNPRKVYTVARWQKEAGEKIKEIISRGKLPIICGGTGFYIDSIVKGIVLPEVPPNKKLRSVLMQKSLRELCQMLKKLDSERLKNIDSQNKVRLIRAIEIAKSLGKVPKIISHEKRYEFLQIGLMINDNRLRRRIHERILKRMRKGMVNEVKNLHKDGLSWKRMNELGLEYRYLALFLQEKITKKEMLERLEIEIWHFAKRQMTWWKRDRNIMWFKPEQNKNIEKTVRKFLTEK